MTRPSVIAARPKGGFNVQDLELGRNPGALTVGSPPPNIDTNPGAIVDVVAHNDEAKTPQYRWPDPRKKK